MIRLITLLSIALIFNGCGGKQTKNDTSTGNNSQSTTLQFRFDKRVETVYFVLMLTGQYDVLISRHPTNYKFAVTKKFSKYREHKAVQYARKLIAQGFGFDYAANWIFQFSDFPEFRKSNEVVFPFSERELNADTLELFRKELINFYKETNCDSFFVSQQDFLKEMITSTENSCSKKNLPGIIEDYYGVHKNADFYAILSPLLHGGGYGIACDNGIKNKKELIALIGPNGEKEFTPMFDNVFLEQDLIIHEFGHSYANEIADDFSAETKKYEDLLYPPVKEKLEEEGIGKESFIYELIVRAITVRIVENTFSKEAADKLLDYEKSIGFVYVTDVADELKNYEANRDKYPTLKDFFPEIIKRLDKIKI